MSQYKKGKPFHDDNVGIHKLDQQAYNSLPDLVKKKAKEQNNPVKRSQLFEIIQDQAVQSNLRRGGNGITANIKDIRTVDSIIKDSGAIRIEKGQTTTLARKREASDLRNFWVTCVMNECYAEGKDPHMIGNFDATQFHVSFNNNQEELVKIVEIQKNNDNDTPTTQCEESILDLFVKYICMANAVGKLATPVFLIADPDLEEDDFGAYLIGGLSYSNDANSVGWLCFCKSRSGNHQFFEWFFQVLVNDFASTSQRELVINEEGNNSGPDDDDSFFMVCDGEEVQIAALLKEDVANALDENKVDIVGKGAASCSGTVGNALDRSHLFKASKKVLMMEKKCKTLNPIDFSDASLNNAIIKKIKEKQPNITLKPNFEIM